MDTTQFDNVDTTRQYKNDLDEMKERIQAYETAKGTQEVKEISTIAQDVNKTLEFKLNDKLAKVVDEDPNVNNEIIESSKILVKTGVDTLKNKVDAENLKAEKEKKKAKFELSESKWRAFGCQQLPDKEWQQKCIEFGSNVWFIIRYIVCLLFFAPFYFFADMIDSQKGALKTVMTIISWLLLLGVVATAVLVTLKLTNVL